MYKFLLVFFLLAGVNLFAESEHGNMIEFHFGFFTPNIDEETGLSYSPYEDIFGKDGLRMGGTYSFEIFSNEYTGTFSVLGGMEYFFVSGYGKYESGGDEKSEDTTNLTMIPLEIALVYNLDQLQYLFSIPFVFYAKIGLNYNLWWITDGVGDTVDFDGGKSYGGKKGWHYGLGARFLLDFLDPDSAESFDSQYGVNSSYVFVEYNSSCIDDFGKDGFKLGGNYWRFGFALLF